MKKHLSNAAHALRSNLYSLAFLWRNAKGFFFANLFDILFGGLFDPCYLLVTAALFRVLETKGSFAEAAAIIGLMALLLAVRIAWSQAYNTVLKPVLCEGLHARVQGMLFEKSAQMELALYDQPEFYDGFILAMDNTDRFAVGAMGNLSSVLKFTLNLIAMAGVLTYVDPAALLIILASTVLSSVLTARLKRVSFAREQAVVPVTKRLAYINRVFRLREHAALLRLSGLQEALEQEHDAAVQEGVELEKQYGRKRLPWSILQGINGDSVYMAVLILVLYRVLVTGSVLLSQLAIVVSANWRFREALSELVEAVAALPEQSLHMDKVRRFMEYQPPVPAGEEAPPAFERFEMRGVSFAYGEGPEVLRDVSFSFERGERIALVGENGAGKSTLIKLMLGLYTPKSGQILYNGQEISRFDPQMYRARFGVVFQEHVVFAESLFDNVACGQEEGAQQRFERAVEFADLTSRLERLPRGRDTALSREFDAEGVNLSGGESQKVAIARAHFRQADLMILDEPSSALDPLAEARLRESLFSCSGEQTVFLISHRLSTTRDASRILVLADGRISESGTHDQLMRRGGYYARAFRAQAERYSAGSARTHC